MKVLFCVRHNFYTSPGGAQIQIDKTIKYLKTLGVECFITTTPTGIDYNQYDILHLTDLTWVYHNLEYLKEIEKSNFKGPKVLSTIYWPFDDYAKKGAPWYFKLIFSLFGVNGLEFVKSLGKFVTKQNAIYLEGIKQSYITTQRKIIDKMDLLLPNAELEMEALINRLKPKRELNYSVVYNAIDIDEFDQIKSSFKNDREDSITFVARIDPRKNQLSFLKAMMHTNYPIKFIGNPGPNSKGYYKKLKALAQKRGKVQFITHVSQEEVFKHMLQAKVNVLTSWIETPGLVSLEAAYAGCNIVISNKGSVSEYFGNYAFYCEPDNIPQIKKQIELAMQATPDPAFTQIIAEKFSWRKTAQDTLEAYKMVLNG